MASICAIRFVKGLRKGLANNEEALQVQTSEHCCPGDFFSPIQRMPFHEFSAPSFVDAGRTVYKSNGRSVDGLQ